MVTTILERPVPENLQRKQHVWWCPEQRVDIWKAYNNGFKPPIGPYAATVVSANAETKTVMLEFFDRDHHPNNTTQRLVPWDEVRERILPS